MANQLFDHNEQRIIGYWESGMTYDEMVAECGNDEEYVRRVANNVWGKARYHNSCEDLVTAFGKMLEEHPAPKKAD